MLKLEQRPIRGSTNKTLWSGPAKYLAPCFDYVSKNFTWLFYISDGNPRSFHIHGTFEDMVELHRQLGNMIDRAKGKLEANIGPAPEAVVDPPAVERTITLYTFRIRKEDHQRRKPYWVISDGNRTHHADPASTRANAIRDWCLKFGVPREHLKKLISYKGGPMRLSIMAATMADLAMEAEGRRIGGKVVAHVE